MEKTKTRKPRTKAVTIVTPNTQLQTQTDPGSLLALAIEKGMEMDKLSQLLDIYQRWEAGKAKKKFFEAFSVLQSELPEIKKTKEGYNNRYKYAPLASIISQIKHCLTKNGFSFSFSEKQTDNKLEITCYLHHVDGHTQSTSLESEADMSGSKNNIQGIGSTVSYLRRYTLESILGIATGEDDDDGGSYEPPKQQTKKNDEFEDAEIVKDPPKTKKKYSSTTPKIIVFVNEYQKQILAKGQSPSDIVKEAAGKTDQEIDEIIKRVKEQLC